MFDKDDELRLNAILHKEYWSTAEAVFYIQKVKGIQTTESSLRTAISRGGGPAYFKWGRTVRYTKQLIDEWIDNKMSAPKSNSLTK